MVTIAWENGAVRFCDQTRLPHEERYVVTREYRRVAEGIRRLEIRGAPAIGVAAAFGAALALEPASGAAEGTPRARLEEALTVLAATRPTAVNLFTAIGRIRMAADRCAERHQGTGGSLFAAVLNEALLIQSEDVASCAAMAEHGSRLIQPGSSLLTHCNTGPLATAGGGTALGVIIAAHRAGNVERVFVDETRPLLQGARLTMWELRAAGIEAVLITDSTAGTVMQRGMVQGVFVGADRIAANGDTANKIGTYPLAVLARHHAIPFTVVAPTTTIDLSIPDGSRIPIEERAPEEVTQMGGFRIAPEGSPVFSPAFDVTPNDLISSIVTEYGVLRPPYGPAIARMQQRGAR